MNIFEAFIRVVESTGLVFSFKGKNVLPSDFLKEDFLMPALQSEQMIYVRYVFLMAWALALKTRKIQHWALSLNLTDRALIVDQAVY